ncbi:HSP20-like chaperone [Trematosphaeria pertusa]|uniref:HSP20-like chaperone n=1 Tax=Trematosphaeria pertusa TaxID=390896 RepID=A0A6A6IZV2_9PLEO|nr:HSP20-like chaperone [Trematosphaeria pertusa]KAF2255768.1 HSP20-like chaperone [Trematosphaeria pertusa]
MSDTLTPEVTWAQRSSKSEPEKNYIYLTIVATDIPEKEMKLDLQPTSLSFKGTSTSKKVTYAVDLEFFAEIDPKETKIHHTGRDIEMVLRKKELKEEYWPRLLKDNKKMHFLKTDFEKWVDEDEQDAVPDDEDYMSKMNPMGGGDGGFGGIDFSKLGAAQGAGGLPGMEGEEQSSDDEEDDEDMPELEGDDAEGEKKKVEEVK